MNSTASGASTSLPRRLGGRSAVSSCRAQNSGGSSTKTPARPSICMMRSESTAPGAPSRLRAAPLVARLRLGSVVDQVSRLTLIAAQAMSRRKPSTLQSHP